MQRLADKVAIVTGASSGIGAATALALAGEGAKVVLAARRIERLRDLETRIAEAGGEALAVEADVAGEEGVSNAGSAVYSATKAAVNAFSESLRKEVYRERIRISVISPGVVATELADHIPDPATKKGFEAWTRSMTPLQAEDLAGAVVYVVTQPPHVSVNELLIRPTEQER